MPVKHIGDEITHAMFYILVSAPQYATTTKCQPGPFLKKMTNHEGWEKLQSVLSIKWDSRA